MELALSLGANSKPFKFLDNSSTSSKPSKDLGFCMGLKSSEKIITSSSDDDDNNNERRIVVHQKFSSSSVVPLIDRPVQQLDLLPFSPVHPSRRQIPFPWLSDNMVNEPGSGEAKSGFDVNTNRLSGEETEDLSSPNNSGASSFQMDFGIISNNGINRNNNNKRDIDSFDCERTSSRASDDEENGLTRKKLRLSKEQSAFLEENFKEHSTLNPKQKLALAKQLNLRPRQVEVWFQNRRARTKLKQTEVDCEYLKRCCETLTDENRRLQKELQELRALKTSQPFYMQLPATTLTMCPSCERVATTTIASSGTATTTTTVTATVPNTKTNNPSTTTTTSTSLSLANNNNSKPNLYPFNSCKSSSSSSLMT